MSECTAPSILGCCLSDLHTIKDFANLLELLIIITLIDALKKTAAIVLF